MARPFTKGQRTEYGAEAYERSIRGQSQRQIARELDISRATVSSLLREQRQQRRVEHQEFIDHELDSLRAAVGECWRRLMNVPVESASNAAPGLLNALNALHRTRCEVLGFYAPKRSESKLDVRTRRDLSMLSDEQLAEYHKLADKLGELERLSGQLPATAGNSLAALPGGNGGQS